jgi:hypothetical protein
MIDTVKIRDKLLRLLGRHYGDHEGLLEEAYLKYGTTRLAVYLGVSPPWIRKELRRCGKVVNVWGGHRHGIKTPPIDPGDLESMTVRQLVEKYGGTRYGVYHHKRKFLNNHPTTRAPKRVRGETAEGR